MSFAAVPNPDDAQLAALADLSGGRCHCAPAFLRATSAGTDLMLFTAGEGAGVAAAAAGHVRTRGWFATLTFPTPPVIAPSAGDGGTALWNGIRGYCRARRIAKVSVLSYEGDGVLEPPPPIGTVRLRIPRAEFVVDLAAEPDRALAGFSENHRRNIRKAEKQGLDMTFATSEAAAAAHAALFRHSMERRVARGEEVGTETDSAGLARLLNSGAGALAQVSREGQVLASLLILSTASRAYYHSGGSAPEGMKLGASHFAVWRAMLALRARGVRTLCLGGVSARDSDGLTAFKVGFAPRRVELAHLVYATDLPAPWRWLRKLFGR
jgi:GNAT acetyltransferase-like protein